MTGSSEPIWLFRGWEVVIASSYRRVLTWLQTSGTRRAKAYASLMQFDSYRTPNHPHAQISGRISDQSHTVRVVFDIAATDKHEE